MYFTNLKNASGMNPLDTNPCNLLGFSKISLAPGESYEGNTGDREAVLVVLNGVAGIAAGSVEFGAVGGRPNVFSGKPHSLYMPPNCAFTISVPKDGIRFEAALPMAKAEDGSAPFLITPDDVEVGKWGISNFSRKFHKILTKGQQPGRLIGRLIVGETFTPSGNWSTYPPHKHEVDDLPKEVFMEEMYYFRVSPADGWGLAKYYTDDGSIDEAYTVKDDTILMMPKGYHTVVSAPGYTTYYLWFLAGNTRTQATVDDPNVGWVARTVPVIQNIEENLS
ncbi:5-deoxy-glucuronate isomerase [Candidatus Bipolaricaulota bacterium]|nr:5-deoxy-glucuronate isomerase [Candidatus Bipolaricaulota bacterium]